jgi:hypothetical protein
MIRMNYFCQKLPASALPGRKPAVGRHVTTTLAIFVLVGGVAVSGCNRGIPGLVPVSGKLTYKGGPWPRKGSINFSPVLTEGKKLLPAMAHVEEDGSFVVKSADTPGMRPGEYLVTIRCWLEAPDESKSGKSAIPDKYSSPQTSGLKLTVPEGSGPIVQNWDITAD